MRQMLPLYAALTLVLHLEVPEHSLVLLPFLFPQEELSFITD